ncbi:hypothetical protein [Streptomyces silaceus]|uniref:hypothetical protein n=1 Tax=Streptomyces silaceus TaxID=545123 RepID=UPI0006EB682D|nr:hypothetical protein [Streptomyces silaceus]
MSTITTPRAAGTERAIALATSVAPVVTGLLAPLLDGGAAATAGCGAVAATAFTAANYMNRIPPDIVEQLPAGDIIRAHAGPMFLSAITSGMAVSMGTVVGPQGADALMAGVLTLPSVPGILSLGWWAAVALVPYKLRTVFGHRQIVPREEPAAAGDIVVLPTDADDVLRRWGAFISSPDSGTHKHQVLTDVHVEVDRAGRPVRWAGRILAPAGSGVTVDKKAVSSVYRVDPAWIEIETGDHSGEARITVSLTKPADLDPTSLAGAWKRYAARRGGLMEKTHLEGVVDDPNTGGQAAYVVADDELDVLRVPNQMALAGALRTSPTLVSYEPIANDPRRAMVRMMPESPLERGHPFPGLEAMRMTKGGRIPLGRTVSGHPSMIPILDPVLGAMHVVIAGATGSGKGGAAQVLALGYHANGGAMIYADPKGASNPAVTRMAAHAGLQDYGALGAMRIAYWVCQHRKQEAARYELKNFQHSAMRPLAPTILDEANRLLGPRAVDRKEAVFITGELTSQGRFIGMPFCLINHVVNLDQIGGEQAIRANLIKGGSWIILRTDSDQTNLADLPEGFEGIDPADIPDVWKVGEESLIYNPAEIAEDDPIRTFGLGFVGSAGGRPGMQRIWILEDATPHIQPDLIAAPEDVPWWGDRDRMEELANTPLPGFEKDGSGPAESGGSKYTPGVDLPASAKKESADKRIVRALRDHSDPLHVQALDGAPLAPEDYEVAYLDRDTISRETGLAGSTLDNAFTRLTKAGEIHRQVKDGAEVRGVYALGPAPTTREEDEHADSCTV